MAGRSVTVELPDDLYGRLQRRAVESQRSIEVEVVQLLTEAVPDDDRLPPELEQELARMESMDDAALWRAARPRFSARQSRRLESLHFKLQDEGLTEAERQEEQSLVRAFEHAMLIRAQALALLKGRGQDIAPLLTQPRR
jgi:plasmid stability protein